jgi:hypothetical protein
MPSVLDGYQMGDEACEGLSIGLKPRRTKVKAGGAFEYALAIANRGRAARALVLFNDTDETYRTRLLIEAKGKKPVSCGLVVPPARTQGGFKIAIELPPNAAHFSDGSVRLPKGYKGELTLTPVLGGTVAMECEVRGKPFSVVAE